MDISKLDELGIKDDGKWMPFIFHMDMVEAAKLTSDEEDLSVHGCTTVFTKTGDAYIIDTPYEKFFEVFKEYYSGDSSPIDPDNDLEL